MFSEDLETMLFGESTAPKFSFFTSEARRYHPAKNVMPTVDNTVVQQPVGDLDVKWQDGTRPEPIRVPPTKHGRVSKTLTEEQRRNRDLGRAAAGQAILRAQQSASDDAIHRKLLIAVNQDLAQQVPQIQLHPGQMGANPEIALRRRFQGPHMSHVPRQSVIPGLPPQFNRFIRN